MNNDKQKHIELLKQIPDECFRYTDNIFASLKKGAAISYTNIELLYKDLAWSLSKDRDLSWPHVMEFEGYYKYLDYINPHKNHIYGYVYKSKFSLSKMYKNAIINASPSDVAVIITPKQGVLFRDANNLKQDFINIANTNDVFFRRDYLLNHLNNCYGKLNSLTECAVFVPNKKFRTHQGSNILNEELIDLLYSQNKILEANNEIHYAPNSRNNIIKDIIRHKRAMFGELQTKNTR